ncbi:hypothetical protein [Candidatus Nitrosotenuis sp. DW1]|uniref:hypothetical protein n=1 Tax=Candidatus Nitrosotenuis sp. DW1 TaxID=2259672 RepID=UPI0015CBF637|nr:hypothetical protein [Candidatus Nitrosotenuis sp. DW1]
MPSKIILSDVPETVIGIDSKAYAMPNPEKISKKRVAHNSNSTFYIKKIKIYLLDKKVGDHS